MRHPGYFILSSLLLILGILARWIDFPIRRDVSAFGLSIPNGFQTGNGYGWSSYGTLLVLLAGVSILYSGRRPGVSLGAAMALIVVTLAVPFRITFSDPEAFLSLLTEHEQYTGIAFFAETYLPENLGEEPDFRPVLETETLLDRLITGGYFLGIGWIFFLSGGLILLGLVWIQRSHPIHGPRYWMGFSAAAAALLAAVLFRPVIGEYFRIRAAENKAMGRLELALTDYRNAMRWDDWQRFSPDVLREIGSLYTARGDIRRPEYHFYKGFAYEQQGLSPEALFEYEKAAGTNVDSNAARLAMARVLVTQGLNDYGEGKVFSSIEAWHRVLDIDKQRLDVLFFLGRAHYDAAGFKTAVEFNRALISVSGNRNVLADLHSNLGDCYTKLGEFAAARNHYSISRELDDDQNYRALISLVGI